MNSQIKKEEITFICCGKIFGKSSKFNTQKCLESIRKFFPESTVILSTWEKEKIYFGSNLYDKLILNKEIETPYSTCLPECDYYPKQNSYDLQQISMFEALKYSKTKYTVRFRTDFYLKNENFLKLYNEISSLNSESDKKYQVFKQKVMIHSLGTIDPHTKNLPMVHHPSDIFFFGLTEDIKIIYNNNRLPRQIANYFTINKSKKFNNICLFNHLYTPEQYLWLNILDRSGISYKKPSDYLEVNKILIDETDLLYINNLMILNENELGIASKFDKKLSLCRGRFYSSIDLMERYIKYFKLDSKKYNPLLEKLRLIESIRNIKQKLRKHWNKLRNPIKHYLLCIKKFFKWVLEIFVIMFYTLKILYLKILLRG